MREQSRVLWNCPVHLQYVVGRGLFMCECLWGEFWLPRVKRANICSKCHPPLKEQACWDAKRSHPGSLAPLPTTLIDHYREELTVSTAGKSGRIVYPPKTTGAFISFFFPTQLKWYSVPGCKCSSTNAAMCSSQMLLQGQLWPAEEWQQEGNTGKAHTTCITGPVETCTIP